MCPGDVRGVARHPGRLESLGASWLFARLFVAVVWDGALAAGRRGRGQLMKGLVTEGELRLGLQRFISLAGVEHTGAPYSLL